MEESAALTRFRLYPDMSQPHDAAGIIMSMIFLAQVVVPLAYNFQRHSIFSVYGTAES
jgi:hypothetical protein